MDWNLPAVIVCALLFTTGYRIGYYRGRLSAGTRHPSKPPANISDEDIKTELRGGRKMQAIRLYRQRSGAGLKEAQAAVEAMDAGLGHMRRVP